MGMEEGHPIVLSNSFPNSKLPLMKEYFKLKFEKFLLHINLSIYLNLALIARINARTKRISLFSLAAFNYIENHLTQVYLRSLKKFSIYHALCSDIFIAFPEKLVLVSFSIILTFSC